MFSDHKPLQFLFSETRPVPSMASARIQHWALTLSAYNYQIVYRPSQLQANADGLSRLPLKEESRDVPLPGDMILMMEALSNADYVVTGAAIWNWTDKDPVLSLLRLMVLHGWQPQAGGDDFRPCEQRKLELSVQNGCVVWGSRVVVPPQGR